MYLKILKQAFIKLFEALLNRQLQRHLTLSIFVQAEGNIKKIFRVNLLENNFYLNQQMQSYCINLQGR